jgi:ubiquitin-protein ligase E3 A
MISEFVDLYTKYLLHDSIKEQFAAFKKGFFELCDGKVWKLLDEDELEVVVCGNPELDFKALEESTAYESYTKESKVIKFLWEFLHSLDLSHKKKFLIFLTGNDRAPLKGLSELHFTVSRSGPDSLRLPSCHTCFNHLLLPEYSTKERLQERMMYAINHAKSFGLR